MSDSFEVEIRRRVTEILTAREAGDEDLERRLVEETIEDDTLLVATFAALLTTVESFLDLTAKRTGTQRIELIRRLTLSSEGEWE
ncbi:MAG TPA: hypothetical protein VFZ75_05635 [Actinomycetota bacterium]|nr:hypothetical protein [Actinomycetota bacterium]